MQRKDRSRSRHTNRRHRDYLPGHSRRDFHYGRGGDCECRDRFRNDRPRQSYQSRPSNATPTARHTRFNLCRSRSQRGWKKGSSRSRRVESEDNRDRDSESRTSRLERENEELVNELKATKRMHAKENTKKEKKYEDLKAELHKKELKLSETEKSLSRAQEGRRTAEKRETEAFELITVKQEKRSRRLVEAAIREKRGSSWEVVVPEDVEDDAYSYTYTSGSEDDEAFAPPVT